MLLGELVATSAAVTEARGRKVKVGLLAELLRRAAPEEIEIALSWLSGSPRQSRLGVGWAAVREVRGVPPAPAPALTLAEVETTLDAVAAAAGPGSGREKAERLRALMERATAAEQEFLARLLVGELRQGALGGLMAEAVAKAAGLPVARVQRAAMVRGDLAPVARAALAHGEAGLDRFGLEIFRPVQPMLAQPAAGVDEALAELGEAALELKLDGARIQAHREGDEVRVYSRRLNEVTAAVPEVVELVRALPGERLILDGEVIALREDGTPHPFQVTMRRFGRRLDVATLRQELPLSPFFFDLLLHEGEDLTPRPQRQRLAALDQLLPPAAVVPRRLTADPVAAAEFLEEAIRRGHEGLMAKDPAATYDAGARGGSWRKIKPVHTLDLVVLAAEWGSGRRQGWLSNLHLGSRDAERGGFVMLGKTFKGLTDAILEWQTRELLARQVAREGHVVHVRPELVVEIAYNDLQESPHYPGGLALRFARVKRYRDDKSAAEADSFVTVQEAYRRATGLPPPPRR